MKPSHLLLITALTAASTSTFAGFGDLLKKIEENLPATEPAQTEPPTTSQPSALDSGTLTAGLKEALRVGAERAVAQVSAKDGFLANPKIHIPLPPTIAQARSLLEKTGMGSLADQLETSMNRAAEQAAPAAAAHLKTALEGMSIDDAQRIFQGAPDAATRYFEQKTADIIGTDFGPIVREAMNQVGVSRYYQQLVAQASRYPLIGSLNLDLEQHVTAAAVDGLFTTLAEQEALIRKDPVARTTDLLKQVFGGS